MMDFIKVIPSASFLSVLEELQACPGAPKSIKRFFEWKKESVKSEKEICISHRYRKSLNLEKRKTVSEKSTITEACSQTKEVKLKSSEIGDSQENDLANRPSESLLLLTSEVKWCHSKLRERGMPQRIHQLLNESQILLPSYEPPPRNPELEARIQKLRADQENKEYQRMTASISQLKKGYATTLGNEYREVHKEMMKHLITGMQYLLSVVGTFYGIFMAAGLTTPDFAVRVVLGICGAMAVALAEIYFIIRDDIKLEGSKKIK
ncbi:ATPase vacuolar ER assembly factor Vma12 [Trinorchestia longiramus]|nr:ATPase vacuolar ER assembly factor Vma12 [Trinorchestia longiramus]